MNDTDLKILSEQLSAAEDRITELQHQVDELKESLLLAAEVIDHMYPSRVAVIKARLRALDEEGAA